MKKADTNELLTIYNQLDEFKKTARQRIMEKCGWGRDTFFKKMSAPQKMSEVEYDAFKVVLDTVLDLKNGAAETVANA